MRRPTAGVVGLFLLAVAVVGAIVAVATFLFTLVLWPGEITLTAPLVCPDGKPDAFVVVDAYSVVPGETRYGHALYCMGPRGEVVNVPLVRPLGLLTVAHLLVVVALGAVLVGVRRARAGRR